jgi:DNA polymerase II small subunit/DNA polymerase delta subunit B
MFIKWLKCNNECTVSDIKVLAILGQILQVTSKYMPPPAAITTAKINENDIQYPEISNYAP